MTTNLGSQTIVEQVDKKATDSQKIATAIRPELIEHFKPALLGRMVVVPFLPLSKKEIHEIVQLKMAKIAKRFEENHQAVFAYDKAVVDRITERCEDPSSGARNIDAIINQNILPLLSAEVLKHVAEESPFDNITLALKGDEFVCAFKKARK